MASDVSGRTNPLAPHAGSPTPAPPARGGARERGIPHAGSGRSAGTRNCISTDMSFDADVIVVGAGPAGSTVAMLLAASSVRVRIVDRATFPRDKPCGDYCNPGAVGLLRDLGMLPAVLDAGAAVISAMRVYAQDEIGRASCRERVSRSA